MVQDSQDSEVLSTGETVEQAEGGPASPWLVCIPLTSPQSRNLPSHSLLHHHLAFAWHHDRLQVRAACVVLSGISEQHDCAPVWP